MSSKTYLRYVHSDSFGIIASTGSMSHGAVFDLSGTFVFSAALQNVVVWNMRQGSQIAVLKPDGESALKGQVTTLSVAPDSKHLTAGYSDGKLRVWEYDASRLITTKTAPPVSVTLNGHRASVLRAVYSSDGALLASGAQDTDIVLWDMIAEQGLYRLRGHREGVTDLAFLYNSSGVPKGLVSCSKDTLLKVWDLDTQHAVQTIVGHRSEVWGLAVNPHNTRLVTAAADDQMRMWSLHVDRLASHVAEETLPDTSQDQGQSQKENDESKQSKQIAEYMGSITRSSKARGSSILYHPKGHLLACSSNSKEAEVWRIRTPAEVKKKHKRRIKRAKDKAGAKKEQKAKAAKEKALSAWDVPIEEEAEADHSLAPTIEEGIIASDELEHYTAIKASAKVRSFSFSPEVTKEGGARCLLGLGNNSLESYVLSEGPKSPRQSLLDMHGHRSDIRSVVLSSDDQLIASASNDMVKLWNVSTRQCIRSCPSGFALCVGFCPGDRHLIVGTREGALALYDLGSGEPLKVEDKAHEGAVWSLDIYPNGKGFITGSADHDIKFWDFEMTDQNLSFVHTRTLKMADDVLNVRFSHTRDESKLLVAVAVLDCTVKVFYDDSLKFFLSLYGHKLPVLCMDISSDNTLLATASADKTVKIWGLDFGDCHRSLLAHDDSIMSIRFVRDTHYFFTASKDKTIKYWDADHFEQILLLEGHQAEVWSLAISMDGSFVVSSSHDRSLRIWERTEEQVFLEEEREKELEDMFESELDKPERKEIDGEENEESALASKRSIESIKSGERLMDAIEIAVAEERAVKEHDTKNKELESKGQAKLKDRQPNPLLLGKPPLLYMLYTLQQIRRSELDQALLVLSYSFVEELLKFLQRLLDKGIEIELCAKCIIFLLRTHQAQIISNQTLITVLDELRIKLCSQLEGLRDGIGINLAGLRYMKKIIDTDRNAYIFDSSEESLAKRLRKG